MKAETATFVYFSSTGATDRVIHAIARGMDVDKPQFINLTDPKDRAATLPPIESDIVVIGTPVHNHRLPPFLMSSFQRLRGQGQPAAVVAVYGNVGVGITLEQLASVAEERGFTVIGGASFVGEHSFAHDGLPIAMGRPDERDVRAAEEFGRRLQERLAFLQDDMVPQRVGFPATIPLMIRVMPQNSAPMVTRPAKADDSVCIRCGECVKTCPMGAIDEITLNIDEHLCIRCYSCVRTCQQSARHISLRMEWLFRQGFRSAMAKRQEPQFYL
ncbi:MAG: 4Fe-4S binding protein [Chloroflexota bacterium]|nr:4Fe-4S binding protein [Chloroflexota bacterium]